MFVPHDSEVNSRVSAFFNNVKQYYVQLSKEQINRLSGNSLLKDGLFIMYIISEDVKEVHSAIERDLYFKDSYYPIHAIIEDNEVILGYSSCRYNNILSILIEVKEKTVSIKGENGWCCLSDFFDIIHKCNCNYVVLRKYENLPNSFIDGDHDIDILCESLNEMLLITNAKKEISVLAVTLLELKITRLTLT